MTTASPSLGRVHVVAALCLVAIPAMLHAQAADTTRAIVIDSVTVTATRDPRDVFNVPAPVTIIDSGRLVRAIPNNSVDLFRDLPGLDINGVGPNQVRPGIRGQQGQRVLMLEDGIPMANARRQSDFGELPSLLDLVGVRRVEVVRGPMSVLYGSDAIGGVVNMITLHPTYADAGSAVGGTLGYTYATAGDLSRVFGTVAGHSGGLGFTAGGSYRNAGNYQVPAGTFGNVDLAGGTTLNDSQLRDWSLNATVGYQFKGGHQLSAKFESYAADNAGFGYIDPSLLGAGQPFVQIQYPDQRYWRTTAAYSSPALGAVVLDRLNVTAYYNSNRRHLTTNILTPAGPGATVGVNSFNYTDLGTTGFRIEAKKVLGRQLLTYGADFFNDNSTNTDSSLTTLTGFGPPPPTEIVDTTPSVPDASLRSLGVFAQGDLRLLPRTNLIVGARYQNVNRQTNPTPGVTAPLVNNTQGTVVGTANLVVAVTGDFNLIGAVGRGFRSPNLVESFFNGPVPEVNGWQIANPALLPETNLEFDFGARYRIRHLSAEAWYFDNTIHDGIRTEATGGTFNGLPAYQNENVNQLRYQGIEISAEAVVLRGVTVGANYTWLTSQDVLKPNEPIGETYPQKLGLVATYRYPNGRFWAQYGFRWNAAQPDVPLPQPPSPPLPVGNTLPAFTVSDIRGGVLLFDRGRYRTELDLAVLNLANALYAETPNQSFFRPEPQRQLRVELATTF